MRSFKHSPTILQGSVPKARWKKQNIAKLEETAKSGNADFPAKDKGATREKKSNPKELELIEKVWKIPYIYTA